MCFKTSKTTLGFGRQPARKMHREHCHGYVGRGGLFSEQLLTRNVTLKKLVRVTRPALPSATAKTNTPAKVSYILYCRKLLTLGAQPVSKCCFRRQKKPREPPYRGVSLSVRHRRLQQRSTIGPRKNCGERFAHLCSHHPHRHRAKALRRERGRLLTGKNVRTIMTRSRQKVPEISTLLAV